MTADDLGTPLGQEPGRKRRLRLPFTALQALAALTGLFLIVFLGFAVFGDNPLGGEPVARVVLQSPASGDSAAKTAAKTAAATDARTAATAGGEPAGSDRQSRPSPPGQRTITIIDGSSGARQDVVVSGDGAVSGGVDATPALSAGADQRLLEKSRHGLIPVVAGGLKPFNAYAEGSEGLRARAMKMPVVAIVVAGLGVGAAKTTDAIMKLPAAVTLAFTPYGSDPGRLVERARGQHHEVLLQIPLEPFDYPDNDPGPQTLLTTLDADQNIDRLTWHLSRIQGYVGLANFMGARFVATDAAMQPLIREAAKRGLGYFDDGTTPRSLAGPLAEGAAVPFARADVGIDVVPNPGEIDRALAKLEVQAKERGMAIGVASALPISIERLSAWARQLESRGVLLVPLTMAMLKSKSGESAIELR